ncbi:DMT family transporter [Spirochaeta isovalerica]|uniref:Drug/metabolite transporter (DMT)-like permease n=1 Tax=Spirochaeta isovalerica TaxID=150 RepID=A0A841RDE4_9SPIO|nr:DMT family transporter [Spirochaeta isovalerica]MBB6481010.1 drug/metabolite transporter (DMT)-like permease [Spirochaeta isovalerica]
MQMILGQIFALLTALCWAQNSLIYSHLGRKTGSDAVTHIRLWLAVPVMLLVNYLFTGQLSPFSLPVQPLILILASGFFGFFVADLFLFRAFVEIGPREALVIMTTSPVFSLVFSWIFLGETLSLVKTAGILIILGGVIWVILEEKDGKNQGHGHSVRGVLYALLGALTQAIGLIFAKMGMMEGVHPVSTNFIRIIAGLAGLFIYSLIRKKVRSDFAAFRSIGNFLLLLFAVVVGPVLGIILSLYALNWAPVGIITTLMQVSPVLLLPVDIFVFRKKVSAGAILGTVLAVGGTTLLFLF